MAKRVGKKLNLANLKVDIEDSDPNSEYFGVKEFDPVLTGGKNSISLAGSELIKPGSSIEIEVLDLKGEQLYVEVGRGKKNIKYRDGVSIIVAIHVQSFVPQGNGKIYIVGTSKDGKLVRWSRDITIDSSKQNKTKIRFYKTPSMTVDPSVSDLSIFSNSQTVTASGSAYSIALSPQKETNFLNYDSLRKPVEYNVVTKSGNKFTSRMIGETISLTNITLETGVVLPTTFSAKIKDVLNEDTLLLKKPVLYPNDVATQTVRTFRTATYSIQYTPILPTSVASSAGVTFKKSLAKITLQNLKTFTGNVYRFKVYRKSFNSNVDSEIIADSVLSAKEALLDEITSDRQREWMGDTFDQDQVDEYWYENGLTSLTADATKIIDGMKLNGSVGANSTKTTYVILKDNTEPSTDETYVPVDPVQMEVRSGSAWDSNFIELKQDVEYVLSAKVFDSRANLGNESKLLFYLTGSELGYSTSDKYDGYGIKIGEISYPTNLGNTPKTFSTQFTLKEDVNCTLALVPQYGEFTVSKISIKPLQEFSFSPEIISIRIPFDVSVANERFLIRSELFDVDHKNIPVVLEDVKFFDPTGKTLAKSGSVSLEWGSITGKPSWISNFPNFSGNTIIADGFTGTVNASDISGTVASASHAERSDLSETAGTSSYIKTTNVSSDPGTNHSVGTMYYDTSINAPIWYNGGGNWLDATGSTIYT